MLTNWSTTTLPVTAGFILAAAVAVAADVKVDFDKAFDFKGVDSWAWNAAGPGEVKMARTLEDDPEAMRKLAEPVIVDAVSAEMGRLKLQQVTSASDLVITYYLLLTVGTSRQTLGQFLPATPGWGLPPFPAATQSLELMNQGALVLDLSAQGRVVWRGVAQTKISFDADDKKREELLRKGVRDLLRRYPKR
jgi:hypothetical protein